MKQGFDNKQMNEAICAVRVLYGYHLIDIYTYEHIIQEIQNRTGD